MCATTCRAGPVHAPETKALTPTGNRDAAAFQNGVVMGHYHVLSTMRSQALAFGIPLEDLNLHDIDPDRELLPP